MQERCRFESELADLSLRDDDAQHELIQGSERRRVLTDRTLAVPFRWICSVRTPGIAPSDKSMGSGTGVLVGPSHVLTSAHVLVSEDDPSQTVRDRLQVQIARNGRDAPFEPVRVRGWEVDPRWITKHGRRWVAQPQFDYGLITLAEDVSGWRDKRLGDCPLAYWGAPGRCGHGSRLGLAVADVTGQAARVAGYPFDKPTGTMWTASGHIRFEQARNVLAHTMSTLRGESGSPIWIEENGRPRLVGIHSRPGIYSATLSRFRNNFAVLLTPDVINTIESWKLNFG